MQTCFTCVLFRFLDNAAKYTFRVDQVCSDFLFDKISNIVVFRVRTSHLKEVPFYQPARRKFPCRSFIPRIICELSSVFLVFTLVLLFIFSWPQSRNFIENIVTSVRKSSRFFLETKAKSLVLFLFVLLKKTVLAPNTDGFEIWLNPPVKTLRSYRLFDVINSIEVMTKQNTPELQIRETLPLTYE